MRGKRIVNAVIPGIMSGLITLVYVEKWPLAVASMLVVCFIVWHKKASSRFILASYILLLPLICKVAAQAFHMPFAERLHHLNTTPTYVLSGVCLACIVLHYFYRD